MSLTTNVAKLQHLKCISSYVVKTFKRNYTPRRALMYAPGDDTKKLNKGLNLDVDCLIMDCEDGVAINKKLAARETIRNLLDDGKPKKNRSFDLAARVNSISTGLCEDDLKAILTAKNLPDTVIFPKIDGPEEIKWFAERSKTFIPENQKVNLIILIESALAFVNIVDICKTAIDLSKNCKFEPAGLIFGGDDFCANIGVVRTESSMEVLYARQKLVLVAKAFNLQAIDMVHIQFKDLEKLRLLSEEGARMGYTGKQVIHPSQVPVVQKAFLPSDKEIRWATGLIEAFNKYQLEGKGAFTYEGSMIDMPTMRQAKNTVELVAAVGGSEKCVEEK